MMKGWNFHGESPSSSSNLSAFAPPFTVSPFPNSNPYDPLPNSSLSSWMGPPTHPSAADWAPREFGSLNYTGGHGYSSQAVAPEVTDPFLHGQFSDSPGTNVTEARPYYPQYYYSGVESQKHSVFSDHPIWDDINKLVFSELDRPVHATETTTDHPIWDDVNKPVFPELDRPVHAAETTFSAMVKREQHELVKPEGSCFPDMRTPADSHSPMNQGYDAHVESSNVVKLSEKVTLHHPSQGDVDAKSFLLNNPDFMTMTHPTALDSKYTPVLPAAHSQVPSLDILPDLEKDPIKHNNFKKGTRQSYSSPSDGNWAGHLPALSTRPSASAPVFGLPSESNDNTSFSAGEYISGSSTVFSGKDTHSAEGSERNHFFIGSQFRYGQVKTDSSFGNFKSEDFQSEKFPNDASVNLIRGSPTPEVPLSDVSASIASSFETKNQFNLSMGFPCWKRVTRGHFRSSMDPSVITTPESFSEFKDLDSLNLQGKPCVNNPPVTEQSLYDALEVYSPDVRQEDSHPDEMTGVCDLQPLKTVQNSSVHGFISKEGKLSGQDGSVDGNIVDNSNNGFSDVSFRCVEHVLSSPPSAVEAGKPREWCCEESTPSLDVSMVVRVMHNLSELLMSCSSSGAYNLKEQDCDVLKNATNNLIIFCLENKHLSNRRDSDEPKISFLPDKVFLGSAPGVHATLVKVKRPELSDEVHKGPGKPVSVTPYISGEKKHLDLPNNPNKTSSDTWTLTGQTNVCSDENMTKSATVEEQQVLGDSGKLDGLNNSEQHCHFPDRPHQSSLDFTSVGVLSGNTRDEKTTQAIKTILAENFHGEEEVEPQVQLFKNLWLEAEATLCSMNYRARYDRLKFEMEKSKVQNEEGLSKSAIVSEDLSNCTVFANLIANEESGADASKNHETLDTPGQSLCVEKDVMARLNILKDRDNKSNIGSAMDDLQPETRKVPCDLSKVVEVASETCNSPVSSASRGKSLDIQADCMESSVLSGFSVIKKQDVNSSSVVNLEPHFTQHISMGGLFEQENNMEAAVKERLSILKQRDDHSIPSPVKDMNSTEGVNLESSFLSRLSILKQRDDNLSSMGWDCTAPAVNLESIVKRDYFSAFKEDASRDSGSGFSSYSSLESESTGGSKNPIRECPSDFSTSLPSFQDLLGKDV